MKLDNDLVRTILLTMEADSQSRYGTDVLKIEGVPEDKLHYHLSLLKQANFITGVALNSHESFYLKP